MTTAQAIEGYGCKCGFRTDDKTKFQGHLLSKGRHPDGLEHKSLGRMNLATDEVVMPPVAERNAEELKASRIASKNNSKKRAEAADGAPKITDNVGDAVEIRFTPRVYTATITPILQTAFIAAQKQWGWRSDMPFINFLDTCIYNYFREHGIRLGAYVVEADEEPESEVQDGIQPGDQAPSLAPAQELTPLEELAQAEIEQEVAA